MSCKLSLSKFGHWALGMGHWALGIGHGALGMGHGAVIIAISYSPSTKYSFA
ncbi:hypothetical protein [Nostoc sp.]|uniref:hypothetical protein n=1 Tax=Nostoc sp. TaxID=1180 RepID=UPI002FFA3E6D